MVKMSAASDLQKLTKSLKNFRLAPYLLRILNEEYQFTSQSTLTSKLNKPLE